MVRDGGQFGLHGPTRYYYYLFSSFPKKKKKKNLTKIEKSN